MLGLDVSFSRINPTWAHSRVAEGQQVFVQCLWTGGYLNNPGIRTVAEGNLRDAKDAGMIVCGYINANPWFSADESIREAKKNAGAMWESLVWVFVDVEIPQTTLSQVRALCEALKAEGKQVSIYSARWFWAGGFGNPSDQWLLEYPLWNAYYDNNPDIDFPSNPYGPWTDVIGEQFQGTTNIEGVNVDLNIFKDEFFSGGGGTIPVQEDDVYIQFEGNGTIYATNGAEVWAVYDGSLITGQVKVLKKGTTEYTAYQKLPTKFSGGNPLA